MGNKLDNIVASDRYSRRPSIDIYCCVLSMAASFSCNLTTDDQVDECVGIRQICPRQIQRDDKLTACTIILGDSVRRSFPLAITVLHLLKCGAVLLRALCKSGCGDNIKLPNDLGNGTG